MDGIIQLWDENGSFLVQLQGPTESIDVSCKKIQKSRYFFLTFFKCSGLIGILEEMLLFVEVLMVLVGCGILKDLV